MRVAHCNPLAVRGLGFKAGGRVVVVVSVTTARGTTRRTAQAGSAGSFTAAFEDTPVPRCGPFVLRATGNEESHGLLKLAQPACMTERNGG